MPTEHERRSTLQSDIIQAARRWVRYGATDKPLVDAVMALDRFEDELRTSPYAEGKGR